MDEEQKIMAKIEADEDQAMAFLRDNLSTASAMVYGGDWDGSDEQEKIIEAMFIVAIRAAVQNEFENRKIRKSLGIV